MHFFLSSSTCHHTLPSFRGALSHHGCTCVHPLASQVSCPCILSRSFTSWKSRERETCIYIFFPDSLWASIAVVPMSSGRAGTLQTSRFMFSRVFRHQTRTLRCVLTAASVAGENVMRKLVNRAASSVVQEEKKNGFINDRKFFLFGYQIYMCPIHLVLIEEPIFAVIIKAILKVLDE